MARRVALLLLCLLLALIQTSCWDKRDVEDLGIVVGLAIEPAAGGKLHMIAQRVNPQTQSMLGGGGPSNLKRYSNLAVEADTIVEAARMLAIKSSVRNMMSFVRVVIVSEQYARDKGLRDLMDVLDRDPESKRSNWLVIGKGDLTSLLDEPGTATPVPAVRISMILQHSSAVSVYAPLRLGEFYRLMESESTQPFTAVVETEPNQSVPGEKGHSVAEGNIPEPQRTIKFNGSAVFRQDRMVGFLNEKESRGLLWLRGEVKGGFNKFPSPSGSGKLYTTSIIRSKTALLPEIKDGKVRMLVKIKTVTNLEESPEPIDVETIKRLEAAQAGIMEDDARAALVKAQQEYKSDVFGFGEAVHRRYPKEWKEMKNTWTELFPGVEVTFQIETKIRHTGMIKDPAKTVEK